MTTSENDSQAGGPQHREHPAVVYIRQAVMPRPSDAAAVASLRKTLVARAEHLGWPREHIVVIDEDVGRSAHGHRPGFAHLLGEVRLGRVGMIVCTEPARLARSTVDWWTVVRACAEAGTFLCFLDRVVDAGALAAELRSLTLAIRH